MVRKMADRMLADRMLRGRVLVSVVAAGVIGAGLAACASNPPPRPLPAPKSASKATLGTSPTTTPTTPGTTPMAEGQDTRRAERPARQDAGRDQTQSQSPSQPQAAETIQTAGPRAGEPLWFREGPHDVGGREHRAFAVTAADVREARAQAMAAAYRAYPEGDVAAHEAVRLPDGSWRFYVLMAAGG